MGNLGWRTERMRAGLVAAGLVAGVLGPCRAGAQTSGQTGGQASANTRVMLAEGPIEGREAAPGVRAYLGIPYVAAPVGELRWKPPVAVERWRVVRPMVTYGSPCVQHDSGWNTRSAEAGKEDCLYLNVWAAAEKGAGRRPVLVYLHGGSNVAGSASFDLSDGLRLVPKGVVLVTINYRLGIFGFLRTPALDAESGRGSSGDYGLMDQIAALEWVKRNIGRFGGDPGNVTIFGESAGSVDVGLLMTSPRARGLFAKAVEESGQVLGLMPTSTREQAEEAWAPVAKELGADLAAMRGRSAAEVLAADGRAPRPAKEQSWGYRGASLDGWVLTEMPSAVFAAGKEAPVPLMIGSNVQEIVPKNQAPEETKHLIEARLGEAQGGKLEAVYAEPGADPLLGDAGARWATDRDFRCPVRQVATWHAAHGSPTYVYQFDRPAPGKETAVHATELHFLFEAFSEHNDSAADDAVGDLMQRYWTAFAKTGDPNGADAVRWPLFKGVGEYLHFGVSAVTPTIAKDLGGAACPVLMESYAKR